MPKINGYLVEDQIVEELDGIRFKKLSNNMKTMITDMFGVVKPNEKVRCEKTSDYIKPDIKVTVNKVSKYVSIKSGRATIMHMGTIKDAVLFFRSLGMKKEFQKLLLLYHYGDGTMDGSGEDRWDYHETYDKYKEQIKAFNDEINADPEFVKQTIERFIFQGVNSDAPSADFIYDGDAEYGLVISKLQVLKHLTRKTWNFYENLHIGPLLIRPHAKYAHKPVKSEKLREKVEFYWANFSEDVKYIYNRYSTYFELRKNK